MKDDLAYIKLNLGFEMTLDDGRTLNTWLDEDTWYLRIAGNDEWLPEEGAGHPIWMNKRPWDKLADIWKISEEEWTEFRRDVQAQVESIEKEASGEGIEKNEIPEDIKSKALAIASQGDPLKYLIWQAQRNHLGDIYYQKVLIASITSAASQTSNGIQPGGNGDKGSGKSDACAATYHLVPMDRRLDGSLSPMSLFYLQESGRLKPGMILFSDDVEYGPIIPIYKRATARFQHGITHFTVTGGKNREAVELIIPPRISWWLTAVEAVANEQAFDRQYPISTDSSPGHKKKVSEEIAARRARKELRLADDEGIEVARAIISGIFDNGPFKVLIPQAEEAEWLKVSDFRGQEQFWDLVDALTILRWRQRRKDDDGWLIADDRDLIEAKEILSQHKVAHFSDLTDAEVKVVGALMDGTPHTQKDLTEVLSISQSTLSERLKSILAKSPIITEDYVSGRKQYSINPRMDIDKDFWKNIDLIKLEIDSNEAYRSQQIALSACYRYVIGLPIGIIINNSNRIPSSLSVDKKVSIEKGYPCDDCERCPLKEYFSILSSTDKTDNDQKQQHPPLSDTDKTSDNEPIRTDNDSGEPKDIPITPSDDTASHIKTQLQQAEEQSKAKEAKFKTPTKKPRSYSEMVQLVPFEYASPIEEKICTVFRGLLARGIAPRLDMMVKETGLSEEVVRCYLDDAPWIRKDSSSPAGIVVYLPSEAAA